MKCAMCRYPELVNSFDLLSARFDDRLICSTVPVHKCPACGEVYYSYEVLSQFEKEIGCDSLSQ